MLTITVSLPVSSEDEHVAENKQDATNELISADSGAVNSVTPVKEDNVKEVKSPSANESIATALGAADAPSIVDDAQIDQLPPLTSDELMGEQESEGASRIDWPFWIDAAGTLGIWAVIFLTWRALHTAIKSNDLAKETLAGTVRPWISTKIEPGSGLTWKEDGTAQVTFAVDLKNHGDSPALNVHVHGALYISGPHRHMIEHYEKFCTDDIGRKNDFATEDIFPESTSTHGIGLSISLAEIEEFHEAFKTAYRDAEGEHQHIPTELYISVTYNSTVDSKKKQTASRYSLSSIDPAHPNIIISPKIGEDLSQNEIKLVLHALTAGRVS
jgi:hypothetical protein